MFHPPTKNKRPMETLQTRKAERAAQFLGSQNVWLVYKKVVKNTVQNQLCLAWLYISHNMNIHSFDEGLACE